MIPVSLTETHFVKGVDLNPGVTRVVHHAKVMIDTTASSRHIDAQDDVAGFEGMHVRSKAGNPPGHFIGWTPGKTNALSSGAWSWPLRAGTDLVLQLHLRPTHETVIVEPQVGFYFTKKPPRRRSALISLGSKVIDIPAGEADYLIQDTYTLPVPAEVLSIYPHAHYLGNEMICVAVLPDGSEIQLIHIPRWDFNWQDEYRYTAPVSLPADTQINMYFTYDNAASNPFNPNNPPERVSYGSTSSDEMAELLLQVILVQEQDYDVLVKDVAWHEEKRDIAYFAHHHYLQGNIFAQQNLWEEALAEYQNALQYRSDDATVRLAMMEVYLKKEDVASAVLVGEHTAALTRRQEPQILAVLATAYAESGRKDEAISTAEEALQIAVAVKDENLVAAIQKRMVNF